MPGGIVLGASREVLVPKPPWDPNWHCSIPIELSGVWKNGRRHGKVLYYLKCNKGHGMELMPSTLPHAEPPNNVLEQETVYLQLVRVRRWY